MNREIQKIIRNMPVAELNLIGLGINPRKQISLEAIGVLSKSRLVLHIGEDHRFLKQLNSSVRNIGKLYWTGDERADVYERIKQHVIDELAEGPGVSLVTYGHPLFFDDVISELYRYCSKKRISVQIIAGVSSLDTISLDLGIDYGDGAQILEVTEMVENSYALNPYLHTLLFQIGEYKFHKTTDALEVKAGRYESLVEYLSQFYPRMHRALVIFSNEGRGTFKRGFALRNLDRYRNLLTPGTTLYIPPLKN